MQAILHDQGDICYEFAMFPLINRVLQGSYWINSLFMNYRNTASNKVP
jgi:hypothetical protein